MMKTATARRCEGCKGAKGELLREERATFQYGLLRVDAGLAFGDDVATPVAALILSENVL